MCTETKRNKSVACHSQAHPSLHHTQMQHTEAVLSLKNNLSDGEPVDSVAWSVWAGGEGHKASTLTDVHEKITSALVPNHNMICYYDNL